MARKPEKLPEETQQQRTAAAAVTPSKVADTRAWLGTLKQTRSADKTLNVEEGTRDAKEMLI